jgi:hypothetical protein
MERVEAKQARYRCAIQSFFAQWAVIPGLEENLRERVIFDPKHDRYAVIAEGWEDDERVHYIVADLEIIQGKIWIQADNTDLVIARELEAAGVSRSDIVLGFRPSSVRAETGYAVA